MSPCISRDVRRIVGITLIRFATGRCLINTLEDVLLEQIFAHVHFHER